MSSSPNRSALVTGVTGQDGAYLARLLLGKGYRVVGAVRRSSMPNFARLAEFGIVGDIEFVDFELMDATNYRSILEKAAPTNSTTSRHRVTSAPRSHSPSTRAIAMGSE